MCDQSKGLSMAGEYHFQLCAQVQRPRPAPHFSMRDSSCSCRDIIWEGRVRHYSKVWLGLLAAPAQAFICFYRSSTCGSGCLACTWLCLGFSGTELSTAHDVNLHDRNLGVGTSCIGTWLKLSRGAQAGNLPRPYSSWLSSTQVLEGSCVLSYSRQQS